MITQLRKYQEEAVEKMTNKSHAYLNYGMGTGKTLICLEYLRRTNQKAFIAAPFLVAQQVWKKEIAKHGFDFSHVFIHGKDKSKLFQSDARIKIINYEGLLWLDEEIKTMGYNDLKDRVLIIDESTFIKGHSSKRFKTLRKSQSLFKGVYCLSGTPIPNGYQDLWSQYYMIDRGEALGASWSKFDERYFWHTGSPRWLSGMKEGAMAEIIEKIKPMTFSLRSTEGMPEEVYQPYDIELPKSVYTMYKQLRKEVQEQCGEVMSVASMMSNKARQITQGALYIGKDDRTFEVKHTEKIKALKEILETTNGSPIICAVYFRFEIDMIRKELGDIPVIAGGVPDKVKENIISKWDKGEVPLLLVHPKSLSHGLNMQHSGHRIIWYGLPWSLEQYQQLNGRLVRPGQMEPVLIFHLKALHTKDDEVFDSLRDKDMTQEKFVKEMLK